MSNPTSNSVIAGSQPPETLVDKPIDERVQKFVDRALYAGGRPTAQRIRNFLNGTWLGNPFHVVLSDVPIGAWTVALVFDAFCAIRNRREFELAADTSVAIGLVAAAGTALTGVTDWSDVDPPARRQGLIHALLNIGASALFATSLVLRRKKSRPKGRIAAAAGYAIMSYSAHLGGKMVYKHRVGVDRTDGEAFPEEFVAILDESELVDGKPTRAMHDGVPILLVRRGKRVFALAETCSHFSGPLSEGKLVDDSIECPYHASRFALDDGHVINGPAVHPQPCLDARSRQGKIEVRKSRRLGQAKLRS
jgi:nitrite reductase/ring-hydroxylating ferredoxin subunit/uncharacterized membrane protein